MNPLTNMKNVLKLSQQELKSQSKTSWHDMYKDSAWIFVGGLPYDLTEGDVISVFSQYGEIVNINLIRDKKTGKSRGFCFLCYEDQRSTILTVDNLNGIKILGRIIRVDHVSEYKVPKNIDKVDDETKKLYLEGCAPKPQLADENIKQEKVSGFIEDSKSKDVKLPIDKRIKTEPGKNLTDEETKVRKEKKSKKEKKKKSKKQKKSKSKRKRSPSSSDDSSDDSGNEKKRKKKRKRNVSNSSESSSSTSNSSSDSETDRDEKKSSKIKLEEDTRGPERGKLDENKLRNSSSSEKRSSYYDKRWSNGGQNSKYENRNYRARSRSRHRSRSRSQERRREYYRK